MKKTVLIIIMSAAALTCFGQLTIEDCYRLAEENYPLVKRYELIKESEKFDLSNTSKSYLPQFSLSGKATYQTDVTSIPIQIEGYEIPKLNKDQYQVLGEVSQSIWDGGETRAARERVQAESQTQMAQYHVDMYAIRDRVNDIFFGILMLDEQLILNEVYLEDLHLNYERIESYRANGIANDADLDAVAVEQLTAGQNRVELETAREAYIAMLSLFIREPLSNDTELVKPVYQHYLPAGENRRPELELYFAMEKQYEAQREAVKSSYMPKFGVFVQGGYGNPGLNTFKDKFTAYGIGGVRLSWNFGGLYTRKNNLRKIDNGIRDVDLQRETFLFNTSLQQKQLESEYDKYTRIMEDDNRIIQLRSNIVRASTAKLENGTITTTELMRDMHAEQTARLNKAIHEIQILKTIYETKNLTNN